MPADASHSTGNPTIPQRAHGGSVARTHWLPVVLAACVGFVATYALIFLGLMAARGVG